MSINSPKLTKAQRRELARQEEAAALAAQAERQRRTRRLAILIAAAAVVVFGGLIWWILSHESARDATPTFDPVPLSEVEHTPASARVTDGGILFGQGLAAGEGENTGKPEIGVYLDYMCPACKAFEDVNFVDVKEMVNAGEANLVMHPVAIQDHASLGTAFSTRAASAMAWLSDRAPAQALAWHEAVFAVQPTQGTPGFTNAELAQKARDLGVSDEVAAGIEDGTAVSTYGQWVTSATRWAADNEELAGTRGFGTPTITINGQRWDGDWTDPANLRAAVEEAAGGGATTDETEG